MKKAIFSLGICCLMLCSSLNISAQSQCDFENLWQQSPEFPNPFNGKAFLPSQQFVLFAQGKAFKGADDFEVPEGLNWVIDAVQVYGRFSILNFGGEFCSESIVEGVVVEIYADDNGLPNKLLWQEEVDYILNANEPNFLLEFNNPPIVGAGKYWISVFPIMRNECGNWFWVQSSPGNPRSNSAAFGDGIFNQCQEDWVDGTDECILNEHFEIRSDLAFSLKTCVRVESELLFVNAPNTEGNATNNTVVGLQFTGGKAPYTYQWETEGVVFYEEMGAGLFRIIYTGDSYWKVTAVDTKGQLGGFTNDPERDYNGNEGGLLDVYSVEVTPESGVGKYDGTATFCVEGGMQPYYIEASNDEIITEVDEAGCFILSNLGGGNHSVEISDASGDDNYFTTSNVSVHRLGGRGGRGTRGRGKAVVEDLTNMLVFPNPFSYATNIEFLSLNEGYAEVVIYDVSGREIDNLFHQDINAGKAYRISFNAHTLDPGIYFAQFRTDNEVITQKVLLY